MGAIVLWLSTSKVGRWIAVGGAAALAITVAALRIFSAGRQSQRSSQERASLDDLRSRQQVQDSVAKMAPTERIENLKEWSRRE